MPFKAIVEALDEIEDEAHKAFYKETKFKGADGQEKTVFALDVEGVDGHPTVAALRNAHERQKKETATAKARVAELEAEVTDVPDDFSIEEWQRLKSVDETVKKNPDDPEKKKLHEAEVQSIKAMHAQQLEQKDKKLSDLVIERDALAAKKNSVIHGLLIGEGLTKALVESGVDKRYLKAAKALLEKSVKVTEEDGKYSAVIETDLGETPIDQFVPQWAQSDEGKMFVTPARGADATGSDSKNKNLSENPWSKAAWNMTQQSAIYKQDGAKADRLAKSVGHKSAIGAKLENAK